MQLKLIQKLFVFTLITTLVAIIPFLILGSSFEEQASQWFRQDWSIGQRFWLIVGLLAIDIALPIPSSGVSTYGGAILGFIPATMASWMGMTIGATIGFSVARIAGPPVFRRLASPQDLTTIQQMNLPAAHWVLIVTRPLPILAEAAVILLGGLRLPWSRFLLPVAISNFVIAMIYSALGAWSIAHDVTVYVIAASIIVPLLFTIGARRLLNRGRTDTD